MKKRILSLVLAVLMLFSVLPTTAFATEESVVPQNIVTAEQGGVKVEKKAEWIGDGKDGKARITFTLTGGTMTSKDIPYTDIVLVIDESGSMGSGKNSKMQKAKDAAKGFVDKFFGNGADQGYKDKVRIAVVSYSGSATTRTKKNWWDSDTTGVLSSDKDFLKDRIDDISAYGGTHIQAGIRRAQQILDEDTRKDVKKLIVVLSDGEPTYSYAFTATGTFTGCTANRQRKCNAQLTNVGAFTVDYNETFGNGNDFKYTNAYVSGKCNKGHNRTQYGAYAVDGTFTANGLSNHGVGTIWEANQAKENGTKIFAVGFGLGDDDTDAINTMKGVATDAAHYKAASVNDDDDNSLSLVFDTIATTITKAIAKDATLTDPLGTGFTLTTTEGGTTYTKSVGDLDTEPKTITFDIQYDTANPAAGDTLPTNDGATLTYTDADGKQQTIPIPNPELENLARTVTYVDENNTAYTDGEHKAARYWKGTEVTRAAAPTKQGYTFQGWEKTEGDVTVDANGKFTIGSQNVTFKATWERSGETTEYIVRKEWSGKVGDSATFEVNGEEVTLTSNNAKQSETDVWETTLTLPKWQYGAQGNATEASYTFAETKVNGVALDSNKQVAYEEDGITKGYWTSEALAGGNGAKNTYTPADTYTVTYVWDGAAPDNAKLPAGERGLYSGQKHTVAGGYDNMSGTKDTVPGTWHFNGWKNDEGTLTSGDKIPVTGNITIKGSWTFTPNTYTVSYRLTSTDNPTDAATAPEADSNLTYKAHYTVKSELKTSENSKDGVPGKWTFDGWYNGTENVTEISQITENVTLTGKWTFTPYDQVTLHYEFVTNVEGVEGVEGVSLPADAATLIPADQKTYPNQPLNVAMPGTPSDTNRNWTFNGWYTDPKCTKEFAGSTITLTQDTTLYGYWTSNAKTGTVIITKAFALPAGFDSANVPVADDLKIWLVDVNDTTSTPIEATEHSFYTFIFADVPAGTYRVEESGEAVDGYNCAASLTAAEGTTALANIRVAGGTEQEYKLTNTYTKKKPDIEVTKEVDKQSAHAGETLHYTITITNNTDEPIGDVTITDSFYDGLGSEPEFDTDNKITLKKDGSLWKAANVTLQPGETELKATYTVQVGCASTIKNEVMLHHSSVGVISSDVKTNIQKDDGEYEISVPIIKTLKNEGTKATEEETFEFVIEARTEEGELIDQWNDEISFGEVPAGDPETKDNLKDSGDVLKTITMTQAQYDALPSEKGVKYIWIYELEGTTEKMTYSGREYKLYLVEKQYKPQFVLDADGDVVLSINLPYDPAFRTHLYALTDPNGNTSDLTEDAAHFVNYYDKQKRDDVVKVGPQLNRDDHVAYIMGYPDGTVQPEGEITRAEACTIFFRLLTDSSRDYYFSKTNDYSDVNRGDWFNNAISTLSNAGIVTGYNDGTFRPNQPITRGEMAKIIANFANLNKGTKSFTDLSGHWSKTYVELAAGNGWIAGYPDGSFRPDQKITRAETVTMINRVLERVPAKESRLLSRSIMLTFPDNKPGDWYYIAIQEASNSHEYQRSVYETTGDEMWTKLIDNVDWTKLEK